MKVVRDAVLLRSIESYGVNVSEYTYLGNTCDNVKLRHIKTGRIINIRY